MDSVPKATLRASAALSAGFVAAAGLVFALRGGDPEPVAAPGAAATALLATPSASLDVTASPTNPPTEEPSPTTAARQPAGAPLAAAAPPSPPPPTQLPTPTVESKPSPPNDVPKYTDVAVLALAADARLPSGLTFRECVERAPSHERWPTPVHLYYQGGGRWMVETHVSEVQVVFDETAATFTVGNFEPPNPGCR